MKTATIEIMTRNGIESVKGYIVDGFGIHKAYEKCWNITDLASGCSCGSGYATRTAAVDGISKAKKALEKVKETQREKYDNAVKAFKEAHKKPEVKAEVKAVKETKTMDKKTNTKAVKETKAVKAKKETKDEIIKRLEAEIAELKGVIAGLEKPTTPEVKGIDAFDAESYLASRDNSNRITPELVKALQETEGLTIEFRGKDNWLYVKGDTKAHKDAFNALKFRWSGREGAWFLAPYPLKRRGAVNTAA